MSSFVETVPTAALAICSCLTEVEPNMASAVVTYLHEGSTCVFQATFLLTTIKQSGYLIHCRLSVSSNQYAHSPLTSLINKAYLFAAHLMFFFILLFCA